MSEVSQAVKFTKQDFVSDQEVRWCPGCGDYAILAQMQKTLAEMNVPREKHVFVSGIGCSSRFPYYMNTYGFHTIHGRAPAFASGIKCVDPDLQVWVITGDGDGLSIGGNHLLHVLRRNVDLNIILFDNRIYGLTKGQYSPTSELGKKTKSTPYGSIDYPINPLLFALSAGCTFVARSVDSDAKHLGEMLMAASAHRGSSFIQVFQNCVIFNNGAFDAVKDREVRYENSLLLTDGQPLVFGKEKNRGIRLNGLKPEVVELGKNGISEKDLIVHKNQSGDRAYPYLLAQMELPDFPLPLGIFHVEEKESYDRLMQNQIVETKKAKGTGEIKALLRSGDTWTV